MLTPDDRQILAQELPILPSAIPKCFSTKAWPRPSCNPPANPDDCVFAKSPPTIPPTSRRRVEPCVFGGNPDCSQCGCAISSGLHWVRTIKIAGP